MSSHCATSAAPGPALPALRWGSLFALLVAEVLALTLRYDTATLADNGSWWAELMGQSHLLPKLLVAMASAMLVLGGARLLAELRGLGQHFAEPRWGLAFLAAHLAAFAALAGLTGFVLEGGLAARPSAGAWVIAWFVTALSTFACWVAVAVSPTSWLPLARRAAGAAVVGLAVALAVWGLSQLTRLVWQPLGASTLYAVRALIAFLVPGPVCRPEDFTIGSSSFVVTIAPSCSGYEGIGMIWAVIGLFLWVSRKELRFPHALLLLPLGTAVIWLANVVRIAALIALGTWGSAAVALGGFHSQAGWLAFNVVGLGLVIGARRLPFFTRAGVAPVPVSRADRTHAYLAPLMAIVATAMITGAFNDGFDQLYPLRVLAAAAVLWYFRRDYTAHLCRPSWTSIGLGVVVFVIWMALEPASSFAAGQGARPAGLANASSAWAITWLTFRVIGAVVLVPVAEELAFRGFLLRRLVSADFESISLRHFSWFALLASSVVFGFVHGERWFAGALAGLIYALAVYRRGKLADAVAAHATTNGLLAAYAMATGSWGLWV